MPTCHDFNQLTASPKGVYLIVGFSAGQVQLIDPIGREISKIFNEEVKEASILVGVNHCSDCKLRGVREREREMEREVGEIYGGAQTIKSISLLPGDIYCYPPI